MALSKEVRRLENRWSRGDFPKHLEWIEISNLRGWEGQRVDFRFPIVAIVGENGTGKSTLIQAAASIYKAPSGEKSHFASQFFPDSPWERPTNVVVKASIREGTNSSVVSVRKPTTRWLGNPDRRERQVQILDLRRTQPIYARVGYARLAKSSVTEASVAPFDADQLSRMASVVGKQYSSARRATTSLDSVRQVPVVELGGTKYSGFHQGAGEATLAEIVTLDIPEYSLVLIDEIETSLHPRAQRRLIRDFATIARTKRVQFILTTHSPYVLEELPPEARVHVFLSGGRKEVVHGVSPEFALTRMDEDSHPEADVYVEDVEARILVEELLARYDLPLLARVEVTAFGAASVGKSLGIMVHQDRFARPTAVILDADQDEAPGCHILPGDDAPERVVFEALSSVGWPGIAASLNRSHSDVVDNAATAMTLANHHEWIRSLADSLTIGGRELWRCMSRQYVASCLREADRPPFVDELNTKLEAQA